MSKFKETGEYATGTESVVEVLTERFVKRIARFGDRYIIARYGLGEDPHRFCIIDNDGEWGVMARVGEIITRKDPAPANQPFYITKMWLEYDRFMKDLPATPGEYRELQEFKEPLAVSEPEQITEGTPVYPGTAVVMPVSARITEVRRAKGMSQQDLSAKTGITQARLSRIESGSSEISCSDLFIIAEALQKPVAEFVETHRIGHDTLVWIMNTGSVVFEGYKTIGMSHYDDVYRTVFVAPVKYDRIMVIKEDGSETSRQQEHLDYSNITAIPISGLRKAKGDNGYVLDMPDRITRVQINRMNI